MAKLRKAIRESGDEKLIASIGPTGTEAATKALCGALRPAKDRAGGA